MLIIIIHSYFQINDNSKYIHFADIVLFEPTKQNEISQDDKCFYISTSTNAIYREYKNHQSTIISRPLIRILKY